MEGSGEWTLSFDGAGPPVGSEGGSTNASWRVIWHWLGIGGAKMSDEVRPLHVKVAEALMWPGSPADPPRYDTDWSATGPLIDRYSIELIKEAEGRWCASSWDETKSAVVCWGETPLAAACRLIISLGKAGKLEDSLAWKC